MRRLREWMLRFGGLFKKQRQDRELDEEIESHLDGAVLGFAVALAACLIPARRATKVHPMEALRYE